MKTTTIILTTTIATAAISTVTWAGIGTVCFATMPTWFVVVASVMTLSVTAKALRQAVQFVS